MFNFQYIKEIFLWNNYNFYFLILRLKSQTGFAVLY